MFISMSSNTSASEVPLDLASEASVRAFAGEQLAHKLCCNALHCRAAACVCVHALPALHDARIAAAARSAGFGVVLESRPTLTDVLAALKSSDELRCQGPSR